MKNRKAMILLVMALLAVAMIVSIPTIYAHADEPAAEAPVAEAVERNVGEEIKTFMQEKILPVAINILLSCGTLYIYLRPVLLSVKDGLKTGQIQQENFGKYKTESEQQIKELNEKLNTARDQLTMAQEQVLNAAAKIDSYQAEQEQMSAEISALRKMVELGFANSAELVRKGAAKQICEIAAVFEDEEEAGE